jgi:hypothetical protein
MPDAGTGPAFYSARPRVLLDGREDARLGALVRALLVEETTAGLYRCEVTLENWGPGDGGALGPFLLDRQTIDFGKALRIEIGGGDAAGAIFEGRVSGMEARFLQARSPELLVLAEDRLQDLRMTRRTRTFDDVSDADLFRRVASDHGLTPQVDVDGGTHKLVAQVNQSDLAFLRDRAREADAEVWVDGSTLHAQARSRRDAGAITLTYGSGLREIAVVADLAGQATAFTVAGWDPAAKESVSYEAADAALGGERAGGQSGAAVLQRALGDRKQQLVHALPLTRAEAQSLAESHFRQAARRFVVGAGVADGDARIRVGASLTLRGVGAMFEGKYYVTAVRHAFEEARGFTTRFEVERPEIAQ